MALKENLANAKKGFAVAKDAGKFVYDKLYKLLEDDEKINSVIGKAQTFIQKIPGGRFDDIADTLEEVRIYILIVRDYLYKEYTNISKRSIVIMLLGLAYTVSPIDLIPDSLGVIGLVDDAAVLKLVRRLLNDEIEKYKDWRKEVGKDLPEEDEDD